MEFFQEALPGKDSFLALEHDDASAVFLLNYSGPEQNKEDSLLALLEDYCGEAECFAALSNASPSPMDIPSLYENALLACHEWSRSRVASFSSLEPALRAKHDLSYPYEELERLARNLKEQDFPEAARRLQELFVLLDRSSTLEDAFPDFFVRCVLIDMLTALINAMNQINVKFKDYSDIYFEALYFCRSCPYLEKKEEIQERVGQLLALFRTEAENRFVSAAQIQQLVEENYCSTEFSISCLADAFHVSIAYMSYLFKKELGENFSDYVWALRLKKARELLLVTDMPIDDISLAVGYVNTSSFRRKFKQATGLTPSQMRG